jgi:hypothetical protein
VPSRRAAGAPVIGMLRISVLKLPTEVPNLQSKFDCKKYVQHYMFRYNQKSSIGAPRWEPNDRKRVRSSAPLVALRGAPKGRVGH